MRFDNEQMIAEILKRGEKIRRNKEKRSIKILSGEFFLIAAALVFTIVLAARSIPSAASESQFGAFMLNAEVGGYIAVAVIAFLAGVVLAVLISKKRNNRADRV